ncbi:MAG: hypothetical protein AB8C84_07205 [Oligoflexales bacterium]
MNWKNLTAVLVVIAGDLHLFAQRPLLPLPVESIRSQIFSAESPAASCVRLFPKQIPSGAQEKLKILLKSIKEQDAIELSQLFHPRLKMTPSKIGQALIQMKLGLKGPLEVSMHRFWALQNVENSIQSLSCPYTTEVSLYPQYGYPLMFGVWIQILGQEDLGRVFVTFVPHHDRWVLGGFHYMRWSYHGLSYEHLLQRGEQRRLVGDTFGARMWFDLSGKYLSGAGLYELPIQKEIFQFRDQVLPENEWKFEVQKLLPGHKVKHIASLFTVDGFGLLIRTQIVHKPSDSLTEQCQGIIKSLQKSNPVWWGGISGVRCSFVMAGENFLQEGRLGYIYLPTRQKNPL